MFVKIIIITQLVAIAIFSSHQAQAAPLTFNVDGVITDASNQPLESASVSFRVDIKDSAETCLIYREDFSISMTGSNGYFSLVVGKQTNAIAGGLTVEKVFSNAGTPIPGQSCTYTPTSINDTRKIIVSFNDGSTSQVFSAQEIQSVPYALEAGQAHKLTGALSGDVSGTQTTTTVAKIQGHTLDLTGVADGKVLKYQSGNFVVADDLIGAGGLTSLNGQTGAVQTFNAIDLGTSVLAPAWSSASNSHTLKIPLAANTGVTAGLVSNADYASMMAKQSSALNAGQVWVGSSANSAQGRTLSGDIASVSDTGVVTLKSTGTAGVYSKVTTDAQGRVVSGSALALSDVTGALGYTPVNKTGDTMTGSLNMNGNKITGLTNVPNVATNPAAGDDGKSLRWNNTSGQWEWFTAAAGGSGISSINGATSPSQSFAAPTLTGTSPSWSTNTGTGVHTLDIPMASTASATAGLINNTDYTSFVGKLTSPLTTKGDLLTHNGSAHIRLPAGSNNEVLMADSTQPSGLKWVAIPAAGITDLTGDVTATGPGSVATSIGVGKVTSSHILDGTIVSNDMNFTGVNNANSGIVLKNNTTGTFYNFSCSASGDIPTWTVTGWACQSPAAAVVNNKAALGNKKIWVGNGSGIATEVDITGDATIDANGQLLLKSIGSAGTYTKVTTDAQGRVVSGSALASSDVTGALNYTPVNKTGDTMTGSLTIGAGKYLGLGTTSTAGNVAGQMWFESGVIKYFDGTATQILGISGTGIISFNGSSSISQSLQTPTTAGTSLSWSTNAGTGAHTLNIPMASTSGASSGLISYSEYTSFNNKLTSPLTTKGDLLTRDGSTHIRLPAGSNNDVLMADSTQSGGLKWAALPAAGITNLTGDISATGPGSAAASIGVGKVTSSHISDSTIAGVDMNFSGANDANSGIVLKDNAGNFFNFNCSTAGQVVTWTATGWICQTLTNTLGYTPVNRAGDTMTGNLAFGNFDITSLNALYSSNTLTLASGGGVSGVTNTAGAHVIINAQTATGTGNGGNIILNPGAAGSGLRGSVSIGNPSPTQNYLLNFGSASSPDIAMFQGNSITSGTGYFINNNANGTAGMFSNSSSGAYAKLGTGNYAAIFATSGTSPGYVGIGTTSPTSKLHVNDNLVADPSGIFSTVNTNLNAFASGSSSTEFISNQSVAGVASASGTISSLTALSSKVSNTTTSSITNAYGLNTSVNNTGSGTIANGYGVYIGNVTATNKYGLYAVDSTSKNYFAGKVGIGVTNPSYALDISSNTAQVLRVTTTASGSTALFTNSLGTGLSITGTNNSIQTIDGHISSTVTTQPTISSGTCNFTGTPTDVRGSITLTLSATTCTIAFAKPYGSPPYCVASQAGTNPTNTGIAASTTFSTLTISLSGGASSITINYICIE